MCMELKLVKPHYQYQETFMHGLKACQSASENQAWIYIHEDDLEMPHQDFQKYVDTLNEYEFNPHSRFVKGVTFWAIENDVMLGRLGFRLELNEDLEKFGGHIGYITHPDHRRKGVATQMLKLALETDYAKKIGKILVTCDEENEASEKTILKNGGVFFDIVQLENRPNKKRFWFTL